MTNAPWELLLICASLAGVAANAADLDRASGTVEGRRETALWLDVITTSEGKSCISSQTASSV